MKKAFILSLIVGGFLITIPLTEARAAAGTTAATVAADPQIRVQIGRNRNRVRTRTITRIVRVGRFRYRETVQITQMRNGRTRTRVISRQRIW